MILKPLKDVNIFISEEKINIDNPYYNIKLLSSLGNNAKKLNSINYFISDEKEKIDCLNIDGTDYEGILFNENFIDSITSNTNIGVEDIKEKDYLNGILIYKENILITRLNQQNFGDLNFFIKKMMNLNNKEENDFSNNNNIFEQDFIYKNTNNTLRKMFKKNGYIELPSNGYELTFNGCEIKDQALSGFFYNKVKALLQKIQK